MATGQTGYWSLPLPQGWEAKYDPGQKRYFFINHANKQTSWEDPRIAVWQQRQAQAQQYGAQPWTQAQPARVQPSPSQPRQDIQLSTLGGASNSASSWQSQVHQKYGMTANMMGADHDSDGMEVSDEETGFIQADSTLTQKLKKMFPNAPESEIKKTLVKAKNVEGLAIAHLVSAGHLKHETSNHTTLVIMQLTNDFPTASQAVIRDLMRSLNNSESGVRRQLKELGYPEKQKATPSPSTDSTTRPRSPQPSPQRAPSPKGPTPAEKNKIKAKLIAEFKEHPQSIIEMSLESCEYNETTARRLLHSMADSAPSRSEARSSHTGSGATSPRRSASPRATTPLSSSGVHVTVTQPAPSVSTSVRSSPARTLSPARAASPRHVSPQPKQATKAKTKHKTRTPAAHRAPAVTHQPKYVSENRIKTVGPDHSLAKGPNLDHIINDYTHERGPDKTLRCGPNRAYYQGPSGAQGPDRSLSQGPDHDIRCGPNSELLHEQGSNPTRLLVTAI